MCEATPGSTCNFLRNTEPNDPKGLFSVIEAVTLFELFIIFLLEGIFPSEYACKR